MRDLAGAVRIDVAKGRGGIAQGEPPAGEQRGGVGDLGDGDEERVARFDLVKDGAELETLLHVKEEQAELALVQTVRAPPVVIEADRLGGGESSCNGCPELWI